MNNLHENQEKILDFLLGHPEGGTLETLSDHLLLSKSATKAHVFRLLHLGYIRFVDHRGQVGRPKRFYQISENGQEVFPRQYAWISNLLLEFLVENQSEQAVLDLMGSLADKVVHSMADRVQKGTNRAERLAIVNEILNELGYRAKITQSDFRKTATIEAVNCVYHGVAKNHPQLCQFDIELLRKLSGMEPELKSCIARGQSVCQFCFTPPAEES